MYATESCNSMNSYREKSKKYRNFFTELKTGSDFTDKTMSGDGQFYAPAYNLVIYNRFRFWS